MSVRGYNILSDLRLTARINSVCFSLIWTCAPILVSITSFFVYVARGNELTIGTAFTVRSSRFARLECPELTCAQAIALYQMVRAPLNVIPAWIVQILQVLIGPHNAVAFSNSPCSRKSRLTVSQPISTKTRSTSKCLP